MAGLADITGPFRNTAFMCQHEVDLVMAQTGLGIGDDRQKANAAVIRNLSDGNGAQDLLKTEGGVFLMF